MNTTRPRASRPAGDRTSTAHERRQSYPDCSRPVNPASPQNPLPADLAATLADPDRRKLLDRIGRHTAGATIGQLQWFYFSMRTTAWIETEAGQLAAAGLISVFDRHVRHSCRSRTRHYQLTDAGRSALAALDGRG